MTLFAPTAVVVPVLGRPHRVAPLVESFRASMARDATLYFVADDTDADELAAIRDVAQAGTDVQLIVADELVTFPRKANLAYQVTAEPWLFLCGDDVHFHRGWLWKALREARDRYSLVATNDGFNPRVLRGDHATHPLIRRAWVEERGASWDGPGTLCHEGYRHWFVDEEWTTRAKIDRVFTWARHSMVEHLHHLAGKAEIDNTYRQAEWAMFDDRDLFLARAQEHAGHLLRVR